MSTIDNLRLQIRKYPRLRKLLLSPWLSLINLHWRLRKLLRMPVRYAAGNTTVLLRPEGQIPEALWKWDFELTERDFVAAYLKPGMKVVNIGANVGLYTVMSSELVKPNGEVHAFEPSAVTYSRLVKNLELNGCRNVTTVRKAVSDQQGQLLLRADPLHPSFDGHRFVEEVGASEKVLASDELIEAITLDSYIARQSSRGIDLIIMDVEGAELAVLKGAIETITQFYPTLLMECSKYQEDIEKLLRSLGYKYWVWNVVKQELTPVDFHQAARLGDIVVRREGWSART